MSVIKFYTHGSEDSLDVDIYFDIHHLKNFSFEQKKVLCKQLSDEHQANGNLICIEDGQVVDVFKGTIDEVNNSLLDTYCLHQQKFPNPIHVRKERDVVLKWVRVIRGILSHCSRTKYRVLVKKAINSNSINDRLAAISQIDFTQIDDFVKNPKSEVYKFVVFQMAQYIGLLEGIEVFTKSDADNFIGNNNARALLYRQKIEDISVLNNLVQSLLVMVPEYDIKFNELSFGSILTSKFGSLDVKSEKYIFPASPN